jgi:hypothetical protein
VLDLTNGQKFHSRIVTTFQMHLAAMLDLGEALSYDRAVDCLLIKMS